jgi:hypothetical protein
LKGEVEVSASGVSKILQTDDVILINSNEYLRNLIIYVHRNPKHHEFTNDFTTYRWSSYNSFVSGKGESFIINEVLELFDGVENFKFLHNREFNCSGIEDLLLEE